MKNRYEKIVLEAEKGIDFNVSEGTSGELIIRALNIASDNADLDFPTVSAGEYAKVLSIYKDNDGNKAVVPQGYTVSGVPKENIIFGKNKGLVIYNIPKEIVSDIDWKNTYLVENLMRTYDQFVWIPVELLTANSTLDGIHFNEKFGRVNYRNDEFSESEFYEPLVGNLLLQKEQIDKYSGFYVSRYHISEDKETKKPKSVYDAFPICTYNDRIAKKNVRTMVDGKTVTAHLTYGAEYDTRVKWAIESGTVAIEDIVNDSTELGNYENTYISGKQVKTGEDRCINNIYGFAGNVGEWTQERYLTSYHVIRGGFYYQDGYEGAVAIRIPIKSKDDFFCTKGIGFHATLCIK